MFNLNVFNSVAHGAVLFTAMAASFAVFAQVPVTAAPAATTQAPTIAAPAAPLHVQQPSREAARIAEINERIAVMSAQLAELEMQSKISAKRTEIDKAAEVSRGIAVDDSFIPSVREINGVDGRIWAVLNVAGGNTQIVRVGNRVGPWRVTQILHDSVTVKRGKDTLHLSFGFNTPQPVAGGGVQPVQPGLPPFPSR